MNAFDEVWGGLTWTKWVNLDGKDLGFKNAVPSKAGLYRIRATNWNESLAYIGQTGRSLRERLSDLSRNIRRPIDSPPWNDPHTAAPALWAFRIEDHFEYQVSIVVSELDYQFRQCCEDKMLYLHRIAFGQSTLCNHGRRHPSWTRTSNRKRQIAARRLESPIPYPSLPPAQGNRDLLADDWLGLPWSKRQALADIKSPKLAGVYRITKGDELVYLGESRSLNGRLTTHSQTPRFADCLASYVTMSNVFPHQLKERETDLVGAYFDYTSKPPRFQYLGLKDAAL